jgi:hypothetical protein
LKYSEIIADKLNKIPEGQTIFVADAHRDNGKRYVVRSDELRTAFLELERITHELALTAVLGDDTR